MGKLSFKIFLVVSVITFAFCKNSEKADENIVIDDSTKQAVQETKLNAQNVFNSMPDRKVILKLIEESKTQ